MNETLIQKIKSAQRCIQRAREIYDKRGVQFLVDYDAQDAAVLNLIRASETTIDLANYLIKRDKLGIPASSAESFDLLAQAGRISPELARKMRSMVGFRNLAVHQYQQLDYALVIRVIQLGLNDIIAFLDRLMELED